MNQEEKELILEKAQLWFKNTVASNHIDNTKKLVDSSKLTINPFLAVYLANFLTGKATSKSIAKALLYPRVLGTSITTSFGTNIQNFTNDVLSSFGSTTSGIDIEFIDQLDNTKVYCQLKAGPNTINKDDVETISGHFNGVIHLGRTNNLRITHSDMIVGVIYGDQDSLSSHYKRITKDYHFPVYVGAEFWHRLTGDAEFYNDLIHAIGEVAIDADFKQELKEVVKELSKDSEIRKLSEN